MSTSAQHTVGFTSVLREAIAAAVKAHGKGLILPSEMQIDKQADPKSVRSAPSFATSTGLVDVAQIPHACTLPVLARFLGFVKAASQIPTNLFIAAFGAEELIAARVPLSVDWSKGTLLGTVFQTISPAKGWLVHTINL